MNISKERREKKLRNKTKYQTTKIQTRNVTNTNTKGEKKFCMRGGQGGE